MKRVILTSSVAGAERPMPGLSCTQDTSKLASIAANHCEIICTWLSDHTQRQPFMTSARRARRVSACRHNAEGTGHVPGGCVVLLPRCHWTGLNAEARWCVQRLRPARGRKTASCTRRTTGTRPPRWRTRHTCSARFEGLSVDRHQQGTLSGPRARFGSCAQISSVAFRSATECAALGLK